MKRRIPRRTFIQQTGALAGGLLLGACSRPSRKTEPAPTLAEGELPRRLLGRTGVEVTTFTLGNAPAGFSKFVNTKQIAEQVTAALELGVNSFDTARAYENGEEGIALALQGRRKDVFLGTKVSADTIEDAEKSLSTSFKTLKTDYFDVLYLHNMGQRDVKKAMEPDGVFTWLGKQKKAGKCRFIGLSGHNAPLRFVPFIETGEVDVLLVAINFGDRHVYNFEKQVLPVAQKHNVGILAMKVYGGLSTGFAGYPGPKVPPLVGEENMELAIRYSLGVPGVASLCIGAHDADQVRSNIEMVKSYKPLAAEESLALEETGRQMAQKWGPHFGPVEA